MSWRDILKLDSWEKYAKDQKRLQGIGERRIKATEEHTKNSKEQLKRARDFLGTEADSKKPKKTDKTGKFLNKPKPKQPQSKFIDANPNDTPSNPFNESD